MAASMWKHFMCTKIQLCLDTVLICGQSFRWKKNSQGEWIGVIAGLVWQLKQTDDQIFYKVYGPKESDSAFDNLTTDNVKSCCINNGGENVSQKSVSMQELTSPKTNANSDMRKDSKVKTEVLNQNAGPSPAYHQVPVESAHSKCVKKTTGKLAQSILKENKTVTPRGTQQEATVVARNSTHEDKYLSILQDYFQLDIDLENLYTQWSSKDPHFLQVSSNFPGIRILRQDPIENLISFVCSSNNHISRISSMIEKLCLNYGNYITTLDGVDYHAFPTLSSLCGHDVESNLRELGFGYRAKFIASIANHIIHEKGDGWVESLRCKSYTEAKAELMTLLGVGAKVSDCVCLMSLDKPGAVPVDTHVWQITMKNYIVKLQSAKSLTEKLYNEIGDFYRNLWGPYAGWAHSVLFTADLRHNMDKVKEKVHSGSKRNSKESLSPGIQREPSPSVLQKKRKRNRK